ncbi:M56 family metallopeptidase [Parafilimonas sp.]|uniref:M56 family metallopeptidase n=1 Tax=Parafilimonas sp. TaxID=1969739 RepID=UPI0039E2A312
MTAYLLKTALCAALFLLAYRILFERETFHRFKRFYLLLTVALCFIIPALTFKIHTRSAPVTHIAAAVNTALPAYILPQQTAPLKNTFQMYHWLVLYLIVTCFFLFRFIKNLAAIMYAIRSNANVSYNNTTLVLLENKTEPYSFLRYIFLNKNDFESRLIQEEILWHELAHIKQKHSFDILFIEWLLAFAWFNPALYFYKKAIQLNHEFLADEAAAPGHNKQAYQLLLLNHSAGSANLCMANHFNYLITKKRLIMLTKTKSNKVAAVCRQSFAAIVIAAAVFFFSKKSFAQEMKIVDVQLEDQQASGQAKKSRPKDTANMKIINVQLEDIQPEYQDTSRPYVLGKTIGSTKNGVSQQLLDEYAAIINKYEKEKNGLRYFGDNITAEDKQGLIGIFKQMSDEQQHKQIVYFLASPKPFSKITPTAKQFEAFKNPSRYGIWIDEKKVDNTILNNYANTDFDHVLISKLYGPAKKNKKYNYQVNLMTKDFYKQYYKQAIIIEKEPIMVAVVKKTEGKNVQHN